ncbi:hypothetical protein LEP1GSC193_1696 [Leptospira alstonii serovar Pingchang str. 80-412]|uniref:Uncharacterized protein n=2 Tax=Leptospira alstonii TaxID=28452 RepID=M6CY67_9LEPT|nr:hypothetical protein LEP1GSC194_4310 [Leptospira alstonii serovar Sichuan str. 79601]EQA78726.1 hypothetical protein LEP1GSC193_1696 [Leptospira alstonii serovar Pingchang str. 80-412]
MQYRSTCNFSEESNFIQLFQSFGIFIKMKSKNSFLKRYF